MAGLLPGLALLAYLFESFGLWRVLAPHMHGEDERLVDTIVTAARGTFYLTVLLDHDGAGWITSIFLTDPNGRRRYLRTPPRQG